MLQDPRAFFSGRGRCGIRSLVRFHDAFEIRPNDGCLILPLRVVEPRLLPYTVLLHSGINGFDRDLLRLLWRWQPQTTISDTGRVIVHLLLTC